MLKLALFLLVLVFPGGRRAALAALRSVLAVWRPTTGLLAVAVLVGAAVMAVREDWWLAAALLVVAAALALAARRRPTLPEAFPAADPMDAAQARSILGVPEGAAPDAVEAAYRRLIRLAHPDQGGTTGLAAQLNAARAALRPR